VKPLPIDENISFWCSSPSMMVTGLLTESRRVNQVTGRKEKTSSLDTESLALDKSSVAR
jgi:hypothetical protein